MDGLAEGGSAVLRRPVRLHEFVATNVAAAAALTTPIKIDQNIDL